MRRHKYLIVTIAWMLAIFIFSSENGNISSMNNSFVLWVLEQAGIDVTRFISLEAANFIIRKAGHFTEYFVLGMLLVKTFECYLRSKAGVISIIAGFLYACSDEIHQYFVPGRSPAIMDVMIDTAGVLVGIILLFVIKSKRLRYKSLADTNYTFNK